jgi:hypothetical protein
MSGVILDRLKAHFVSDCRYNVLSGAKFSPEGAFPQRVCTNLCQAPHPPPEFRLAAVFVQSLIYQTASGNSLTCGSTMFKSVCTWGTSIKPYPNRRFSPTRHRYAKRDSMPQFLLE